MVKVMTTFACVKCSEYDRILYRIRFKIGQLNFIAVSLLIHF